MPPRYIEHLTIDTGDQRRSYRDEVRDDILALLRPLLDRVVAGEEVPVPGVEAPPCSMRGARGHDRALMVTISATDHPTEPRIPLVSIGVAPSSKASREVWQAMTKRERDDMTPRAPWCAVRIYPTATLYPTALAWLGDLERCIAWAWIDRG